MFCVRAQKRNTITIDHIEVERISQPNLMKCFTIKLKNSELNGKAWNVIQSQPLWCYLNESTEGKSSPAMHTYTYNCTDSHFPCIECCSILWSCVFCTLFYHCCYVICIVLSCITIKVTSFNATIVCSSRAKWEK